MSGVMSRTVWPMERTPGSLYSSIKYIIWFSSNVYWHLVHGTIPVSLRQGNFHHQYSLSTSMDANGLRASQQKAICLFHALLMQDATVSELQSNLHGWPNMDPASCQVLAPATHSQRKKYFQNHLDNATNLLLLSVQHFFHSDDAWKTPLEMEQDAAKQVRDVICIWNGCLHGGWDA